MFGNLNPMEMMVVCGLFVLYLGLLIVSLLVVRKFLPDLKKSLGVGMAEFKKGPARIEHGQDTPPSP